MNQEELTISVNDSGVSELGKLIVSVRDASSSGAEVLVGRPGQPNASATLQTGDALLFETVDGMFEARLMKAGLATVKVLVSQVSRAPGILGGFVEQDQSNTHFKPNEQERIARSIEAIIEAVDERFEVQQQQLEYISRELAEMNEASSRLGRKDWMNCIMGVLMSIAVNAALPKDTQKAFFQLVGESLDWLSAGGIKLLC